MWGVLTPPSNLITVPVKYEAKHMDSTASANSGGLPRRPKGVLSIIILLAAEGLRLPIGVVNICGANVTTLILYLPKSLAMGKVIPMTAPLLKPYTTIPLEASIPATLATLTITLSQSLFVDIMCLATYLLTFMVPTTFIINTLHNSLLSITLPLLVAVNPNVTTPAEFKRISIFPNLATAAYTSLQMESSSVTSNLSRINTLEESTLARYSFASWVREISATTTLQPSKQNFLTVSRPNPEPAPVMNMTVSAVNFIFCQIIKLK